MSGYQTTKVLFKLPREPIIVIHIFLISDITFDSQFGLAVKKTMAKLLKRSLIFVISEFFGAFILIPIFLPEIVKKSI